MTENKKVINAWCMYDWANSVYSLVITSAIFPAYYNHVTSRNGVEIDFFGYSINNSVLLSYSLATSFLVVSLVLPLLSGIADSIGRKKLFLQMFMYMGAVSCIGLFFFEGENVEWGILCSVFASIGYAGGLVFYDGFLPEITSDDRADSVSARGYAFGYVGSVILMGLNIVMINSHDILGFKELDLTRLSFLTVGLWWIGFSQITFWYLPENKINYQGGKGLLTKGYNEISKVFMSLRNMRAMTIYLISFFFYNMGVQTVMYLAATFGSDELKLETTSLITTVLIIQLVAIAGAYLFAYISRIRDNKTSLMIMITIWVIICFSAYSTYTETQFYMLAFFVGLVMGGIQSLSRATYSKLIPENSVDNASYFSFYDVAFYLSTALGTFSFGFIKDQSGSMRNSTIALAIFFIIGLVVLSFFKMPRKADV